MSGTSEITLEKQTPPTNRKAAIIAIICAVILFLVFCGYCAIRLTYDKVYEGVLINGVSVSGLTRDELCQKIPELFDKQLSKRITLEIDGQNYEFESLSIVPVIDTESMADVAFSQGRTKPFLARLGEISSLKKNPVTVPFELDFNNNELQKVLNSATENLNVTAVPNKIDYGENSLLITKGTSGNGILFDEAKLLLESCILGDSDTVKTSLKYIEPEEITYDYIMRFVSEQPIDASYSIENHRLKFTESVPGVSLKKSDLQDAMNNAQGNVITVPAEIVQPGVTSEYLQSTVVADELGKFSTDFSSSSADRAYNIKLACEKINGHVLEPGEEFSYNDVVGPRTADRGFRIANVYVGNTVQPGIGGGICQVSSTMYNAVIFANLEITERRNHTLPVSYVPMGRDATVSYGTTDFKFKNNTSMPVEIIATAENGTNTIIIMGTNENPNREIKIETSCTGTTSPKVVVKTSSELLEGEVSVESSGSNGSSYVAYKVIYENGAEVSRTKLPNSTYAGKDRVEIHGTGKPEPSYGITPSQDYNYDQAYPSFYPDTSTVYPSQSQNQYQGDYTAAPPSENTADAPVSEAPADIPVG